MAAKAKELTSSNTNADVPSNGSGIDLVGCLFEGDSAMWPNAMKFLQSLAAQLRTPQDEELVQMCIGKLDEVVQKPFPDCRVFPFGSIQSGFGTRNSDLDVTFVGSIEDGASASSLLQQLLPAFENHQDFSVVEERWSAKIPIIKLRFRGCLDVDLSCNNTDAIRNSTLLRGFATCCPAVRDLVVAVKLWSKARGVNGASEGNLSSYSFTLMAIYFLQVDTDVISQPLYCNGRKRGLTLDLMQRFFEFYSARFAWGFEVVSVRLGQRSICDKHVFPLLSNRGLTRLHVEDPCLTRRNLNCVLKEDQEQKLYTEICSSYAQFVCLSAMGRNDAPREKESTSLAKSSENVAKLTEDCPVAALDTSSNELRPATEETRRTVSLEKSLLSEAPAIANSSINETKRKVTKGIKLKNQKLAVVPKLRLETSSSLKARQALFDALNKVTAICDLSNPHGSPREGALSPACDDSSTRSDMSTISPISEMSSSEPSHDLDVDGFEPSSGDVCAAAAAIHVGSEDSKCCPVNELSANHISLSSHSTLDFVKHGKTPITNWPNIGDRVFGWFFGEWHPATIYQVHVSSSPSAVVLWESEWSVTTLPLSHIAAA